MWSLKQIIGSLLAPSMICLFLLTFGTFMYWRKRPRWGRLGLGGGALMLLFFSNGGVANLLIRSLEQRYPPATATITASCAFIAVLGGGHADDPAQPWTNRLARSSLGRLVEAVRLAKLHPDAQLIFCGANFADDADHATALAGAARELGLDPARFHLVTGVHDTHDEVHRIRDLAGPLLVALVTSAWHMPRAMGLAEGAGLQAVPCPTDYLSADLTVPVGAWFSFGFGGMETSNRATREYLGLTWTALRGQR